LTVIDNNANDGQRDQDSKSDDDTERFAAVGGNPVESELGGVDEWVVLLERAAGLCVHKDP
jgi:hypothetical protein